MGTAPECTGFSHCNAHFKDGPALRAITLSRFALHLLDSISVEEFNTDHSLLYASGMAANSTIKADLDYISHHWNDRSYDLWEEAYASGQFFNTMAFREALTLGAQLARKLDDAEAAELYELQLSEINKFLHNFWDAKDGWIKSSIKHERGVEWKIKHLDASVLIAVMFSNSTDENYPYSICISSIVLYLIISF